ncbi:hypothetical protein BDR26DRAFT_855090 [Obelidium mucronatum]|nr:hypothetical protein BDR26DRAFT_855090 [Obelidium mucronatum]
MVLDIFNTYKVRNFMKKPAGLIATLCGGGIVVLLGTVVVYLLYYIIMALVSILTVAFWMLVIGGWLYFMRQYNQ